MPEDMLCDLLLGGYVGDHLRQGGLRDGTDDPGGDPAFAIDEEGGGDAAGRQVGEFDQLGAARVVYRGVGHIERAHKGAGGCGVVVTDVEFR